MDDPYDGGRARMSGTIWLITEDRLDADVIRALLRARGMDAKVKPMQTNVGVGGLSRLVANLEELIQFARERKSPNDCIAVLHDADEHSQSRRDDYAKIKRICDSYTDVVLVVARDEVESWLLADAGLCRWLNVKPKNWDEQKSPAKELNSLLKKNRRMKYQGRYRDEVLKHLDGTGDKFSPSLQKAFKHLEGAPCVQS